MSLDFITELEHRIESLVGLVGSLRAEKDQLNGELAGKNNRIGELESECGRLAGELEGVRNEISGRQGQIDQAADRVRAMLARLEGVA